MQPTQTIRLSSIYSPTFLVSPAVEWLHAIDLVVMAEGWGEGFAPWVYATRTSLSGDRFETLAACSTAIRWERVVSRIEAQGGLENDFEWMAEWILRLSEESGHSRHALFFAESRYAHFCCAREFRPGSDGRMAHGSVVA